MEPIFEDIVSSGYTTLTEIMKRLVRINNEKNLKIYSFGPRLVINCNFNNRFFFIKEY